MLKTSLCCCALALAFAAPLGAAVPVPQDLRNPFAVPDPAGFKTDAKPGDGSAKVDPEVAARNAAFAKVVTGLRELPVKGFANNVQDPTKNTLLLGPYIIKRESYLPAGDFGVEAIIKVIAVKPEEMKVSVTIGLENRPFTIPLAR